MNIVTLCFFKIYRKHILFKLTCICVLVNTIKINGSNKTKTTLGYIVFIKVRELDKGLFVL